uniref:Phosphatidylinositol transfer protein beta isoform n=1 Tax=Monopterus albus TaxID=43700 RepID=A0A3Q3IF04_MONAL
MVLIKEYCVVLPVLVEEYQVGQLYSVAEASKNETGGRRRRDITHTKYAILSPEVCEDACPRGSVVFHEKAWNTYPYLENVRDLDEQMWQTAEVVPIDIENKEVVPGDYKPEEDPALFHSANTGRGPLSPEWKNELKTDCPYMCAYKLVTVKFRWWGLQTKVENFIHRQEKRIFTSFHRQLFCWIDKWVGLTMEDLRQMEEETQKELEEMRQKVCGQHKLES